MNKKLTTEKFIANAVKVHGSRFNYDKVVYQGKLSSIVVTCSEHGDYQVSPTVHLQGRNPRCCMYASRKGVKRPDNSPERIAQEAAKKNGDMYYLGTPCYRCKNTKRYTCNRACAFCSITSRQKSNAKHNSVRHKRIYQANIYRDNVDIQNELKLIYLSVRKMEKSFKEKLHIDHIIPIKAKNACGLHVPWNLMVTTATYNQSKQAKISLDIPMCLKRNSVIIHQSALPWNLKKENHVNIL
jgi:hypothetical protein